MTPPVIYHDPTSEPSRAVRWLCLEANIHVFIKYVWLTRGEHVSAEFLKVNPLHQVPAMKHGAFCLSEASAIMNYLTDLHGVSEQWFGNDIQSKAVINKYLSWYHTNLRKALTLDYFLPVLLMPVYLGFDKPSQAEIEAKLEALHQMFRSLEFMLEDKLYLAGNSPSAADILYVADLVALKVDPNFQEILSHYPNIIAWLARLESRPAYVEAHKAWEHVVPMILELNGSNKESPAWVARACEEVL